MKCLKDIYGENFENLCTDKNFYLSALENMKKLEKEIEELTPMLEYFKENKKNI